MKNERKRFFRLLCLSFLAYCLPGGDLLAQTCVQPPPGLVGWWPGDGDARDVIGPNHGSLTNGTVFANGKVEQAFSFDGVDDEVSLGTNNIVGSGSSPFTIAMWVYPTTVPTGAYCFLGRFRQDAQFLMALTSDYNLNFSLPGDYIVLDFRGEGHQWWIPINLSSMLNQWTHVAAIYNGGDKSTATSFAVYFNGVPLPVGTIDAGPVGGSCNDNVVASYPGSACAGGSVPFRGLIDEVQAFNRVLSQGEIQSFYNAGSAGACKPVITVTIDIKPGSFPNSINLGSGGTVPVAIFSTSNFDATTVNPTTVTLAGAAVNLRGQGTPMASFQDLNGDSLLDLVVHVSTQALQLSATDTEAILEGQTFNGQRIRGSDSVRIVP